MQIGVYGYTDKRPVIYPILKLLQATGDVAFLSNNRHYKRLLEDNATQGHIANIMISISDASSDEIFEELGQTPDDFDHIVYDMLDSVPDNLDLVIHVKTYPPSEDEKDFLSLLGEPVVIKITYDRKIEKGIYNVPPVTAIWDGIEFMEAFKVLAPMKSPQLNTAIGKVLSTKLNMTSSSAIKILNRRWQG